MHTQLVAMWRVRARTLGPVCIPSEYYEPVHCKDMTVHVKSNLCVTWDTVPDDPRENIDLLQTVRFVLVGGAQRIERATDESQEMQVYRPVKSAQRAWLHHALRFVNESPDMRQNRNNPRLVFSGPVCL